MIYTFDKQPEWKKAGVLFKLQQAKIPLGKPRQRWEDNITIDLEEMGMNTRNWFDSAQERDYWRALVNLRTP